MRISNPPEHQCPNCEDHPQLEYMNSVGPVTTGLARDDDRTGPTIHFYDCDACGCQYMATSGGTGPLLTPPNQDSQHRCPNCSAAMIWRMVPVDAEIPDSAPPGHGGFRTVPTKPVWKCRRCGVEVSAFGG
jgi:predicted RNA-binding Zn-ribbon protein involved in translation (DUF1610 family)